MFDFFDAMRRAGGGPPFDDLARRFGISPEEVQRAVETLVPAFTAGMQRAAADPMGWSALASAMAPGRGSRFYDSPSQGSSPDGDRQAQELLGRIFGSPEVARSVAQHAASMAGVGTDIMNRMMPVVASMMMSGLAQFGAAGQGPGATQDAAKDAMRSFETMMRGMLGGAAPSEHPGEGAAAGAAPDNPFDAWTRMVQSGREVHDQQLKAWQNVLDSFWGAPRGRA